VQKLKQNILYPSRFDCYTSPLALQAVRSSFEQCISTSTHFTRSLWHYYGSTAIVVFLPQSLMGQF